MAKTSSAAESNSATHNAAVGAAVAGAATQVVHLMPLTDPRNNVEQTGVLPIEAGVDKADIIAIGVSNQEEKLLEARSQIDGRVKTLKAQIAKLADQHQKDCTRVGDDDADPKITEVRKLLERLGFKGFDINKSVSVNDDKHLINVSVTVGNGQNNPRYTSEIRQSATQKAQLKMITDLREQLRVAEENAVDIRKQLSDLPRLERKFRAQLAAHSLNQSTEGKKLLDRLNKDNTLTKTIPMLTGTTE